MSIILAIVCFIIDFFLQVTRTESLPVILQPQCLIPMGLTFTAMHLAGVWAGVPWRGPPR